MRPLTVTVFPIQLSSQADAQGRAVTLVTTDAYKFYEFVGFELVAEKLIGDDNPSWDGPPVPIRIVSAACHIAWIVVLWWQY